MQSSTLSVTEAASYLGVSASWLNKLRVLGGGPIFIKVGRRVLYDRDDLTSWLDDHRRQSTSALG